jgi:hypothetical protein
MLGFAPQISAATEATKGDENDVPDTAPTVLLFDEQ